MASLYILIPDADKSSFIWLRPWVKLLDGPNTYYLDPALKTTTQIAGLDVASAMQLNVNNLLAAVATGSTINSDYVQNLNFTQLKTTLSTYTANLLQDLTTAAHKNRSVEEVLSGFHTDETETLALPTALTFTVFDG